MIFFLNPRNTGNVGTGHSGTLQLSLFQAAVARDGGLHGARASSGGKTAGKNWVHFKGGGGGGDLAYVAVSASFFRVGVIP